MSHDSRLTRDSLDLNSSHSCFVRSRWLRLSLTSTRARGAVSLFRTRGREGERLYDALRVAGGAHARRARVRTRTSGEPKRASCETEDDAYDVRKSRG